MPLDPSNERQIELPEQAVPTPEGGGVLGQSASLALVHEPGQQPSPARQAVTVSHEAGQSASLAPLQAAGQQPSPPVQVVTVSQEAGQSLSWVLVQPAGQQPSPAVQVRMRCWVQAALQVLVLLLSPG